MASSFGRSRVGLRDDLDRLQTSYQEFHDDAEDSDEDSAAPPQFQQTSPTYQNKTRMGFGQNDKQLTDSKGFSRPNLFSPNMSPSRPLGEIYGKKNYNGIMHTEDSPEGPPGGPGTGGNVIIHHVPEESKSRWSHIEDLDSFFKKVYEYHQRHGFTVMMLQVQKISQIFRKQYC